MRFGVPAIPSFAAPVALGVGAVLFAFGGVGCVRPENAADRHFAEMRDSVGRLQAEQDRESGLVLDPEAKVTTPPARGAQPAPAAGPPRTVQIGVDPDEALEDDDPNAPGARPEIRIQGTGGAASSPPRTRTRTNDDQPPRRRTPKEAR